LRCEIKLHLHELHFLSHRGKAVLSI